MDMKNYLKNLSADHKKRFARRAKTSLQYVRCVYYGTKKPTHFETVLRFLEAGDGDLDVRQVCPELFPRGKKGDQRLKMLRDACK